MVGFDEIRKLQGERRWMQFCDSVISSIGSLPIAELLNVFLESAGQVHPRSSCEVFLALSEGLTPEEGVKVLKVGQEVLENVVLYAEDFGIEKAMLEMRRCLLLIGMNKVMGIEKKMFEWKGLKMPRNVSAAYNFLGFRLYQKIQNIETALCYLLRYVKLSGSFELIDTLVEYAMLSKEFFNFTSITSLPGFEEMKNSRLKEIFMVFREGDMRGLERLHSSFTEMFGSNSDEVKEKIYMIALTNLCFPEAEKKISIKKIEELLGITNKMAVYIILKSFGTGLIDGWIDGENGILYFDRLVPRALQVDEIVRIKERFNSWEQRVHEVVLMLK